MIVLKSSINQIAQGFGDSDIYPTLEEKAAMLLYLIIKNHSFVDGNKRIVAACFLYFREINDMLIDNEGNKIIENEVLATLTLFIENIKWEDKCFVEMREYEGQQIKIWGL